MQHQRAFSAADAKVSSFLSPSKNFIEYFYKINQKTVSEAQMSCFTAHLCRL